MALVTRALAALVGIAAAMAAAIALGFGAPAAAAPVNLKEALAARPGEQGRYGATPQIARYLIDEGGGFVLDRSTKRPLMKFDDSPEIFALQPSAGLRGDTIYKNDVGEPMLRATKLGGMTVFTPRRPGGSAASPVGSAQGLRLSSLGPVALYKLLFQASVRASRTAQHLIGFEADATPASDAIIADAAVIVVEAMAAISTEPEGRSVLRRITKVSFKEGNRTSVTLQGSVLTITVVPNQGVIGRPSSRRILKTAVFR